MVKHLSKYKVLRKNKIRSVNVEYEGFPLLASDTFHTFEFTINTSINGE